MQICSMYPVAEILFFFIPVSRPRLRAIQLDSGTYLNEPTGAPEQYEMWLPSFNLDSQKGSISELLVANVEVRALYTQLVRPL